MFFKRHDDRNLTEKNNDSLVLWSHIGVPIIYGIGIALIFTIIIGGIRIKNSIVANREVSQEQKIYTARNTIFNDYIKSNPKTFTDIEKTWCNDNLFYAMNKRGTFMIRFVETEIYEVTFMPNYGNPITLWVKQ